MLTTLHAVALRTVRYNDRQSILTAWTAETGRMSFALSEANTAEARRRRALSMPLSLFEATVDLRPDRDIVNIRDMRPSLTTPNTASHPVRAAVAMFAAEILGAVLRESGVPDPGMYAVIRAMAEATDTLGARALANLPLWFMHRLSVPLGFEPDFTEARPGSWFNALRGVFSPSRDTSVRETYPYADMRPLLMFARMDTSQLHRLRLAAGHRRILLDHILTYYSMHHTPLRGLRSLPVLEALLHI